MQRQPDVNPAGAPLAAGELAAWRGFLRTHAKLLRELSAELEREHGLPVSSYEVLMFLADAPEHRMRMAELADSVLLSPSGVTRLVDRLVADRLVAKERCTEDRRGWFAVLTEEGAVRLVAARATHLAGVRARFLAYLDADRQAGLAETWDLLLDAPRG